MLLNGKVLQLLPALMNQQQQHTVMPQVSTSVQGQDSTGSEMECHIGLTIKWHRNEQNPNF